MTVTSLFSERQPIDDVPLQPEQVTRDFVATARAVATIGATRTLLLIAVLTGAAIWLWTAFDPTRDRLYAAIAYSLVFVIPQVLLSYRRG